LHIGTFYNSPAGIGVNNEILTQLFSWLNSNATSNLADLGCAKE
jgi:hypothetical protein